MNVGEYVSVPPVAGKSEFVSHVALHAANVGFAMNVGE
jgi:hypothetical protein